MPFRNLQRGKKSRVVVEVRGPRDDKQQKRFKAALRALLKKHGASIKSSAKKKPARRKRRR